MAQRLERPRRHLLDLGVRRRVAERLERRDPRLPEPRDLAAADPRDARQVVVRVPLRVAAGGEGADRAVLDRPRVRLRLLGDELDQAAADAAEVGVEVGEAEALALLRAEHDVHPLGRAPLDPPELLRVEAELQHRSRLRRARELRVDGLVGAVRLPLEEVGDAAPAVVRRGRPGRRRRRSSRMAATVRCAAPPPSRGRRARSRRSSSPARGGRRGTPARARAPCGRSAPPARCRCRACRSPRAQRGATASSGARRPGRP